MFTPLNVTFKHMKRSEAISKVIDSKVEHLNDVCARLHGVDVLIEAPHRHHRSGNLFNVRIRMMVPGRQIIVNHKAGHGSDHEDVYLAVRDAFITARRRLEAFARRRRELSVHAA